MKKAWFSFLVVCFLGGVSAADANDFKPYIGLGAGLFHLKYTEDRAASNIGMNQSTWGTFLNAGVQYKKYIGLELRGGLTGGGSASFPANVPPEFLKVRADAFFSYLLKPQFPVSDQLKVYGVFGGTAVKYEAIKSSGGIQHVPWKTGVTYGLGLEYQFRLKGSLAIEWVEYLSAVQHASGRGSEASMRGISFIVNKSF
ncbi:outer membrane beta-barrel protein [Mariprofundus sp. KV]|uniref:outer membrane beta-barrel protein n=1 Tax=Mariprofundus sp. KV TaxID=2608715 RepID=UPI0015A167BC|nr:outer membrane beta-barrel protein [Mariprofundus sp. KV]